MKCVGISATFVVFNRPDLQGQLSESALGTGEAGHLLRNRVQKAGHFAVIRARNGVQFDALQIGRLGHRNGPLIAHLRVEHFNGFQVGQQGQ